MSVSGLWHSGLRDMGQVLVVYLLKKNSQSDVSFLHHFLTCHEMSNCHVSFLFCDFHVPEMTIHLDTCHSLTMSCVLVDVVY
jgi:hypothetical protein